MFFQNIQTIHNLTGKMLSANEKEVDELLMKHNWAIDHIATSADDVQEVANFILGELEESFEALKSHKKFKNIVGESYKFQIKEAEYQGKKVQLNKPFRQAYSGKKFAVYVKTPKGNVKKVRFGAQGYKVRNDNKGAAKSFKKRHKCDQKTDKTTPGYWSCNIARYRKALGLSSASQW